MFETEFYTNAELRKLLKDTNLRSGYKLDETRDLILEELELIKDSDRVDNSKRENLNKLLLKWTEKIEERGISGLSKKDIKKFIQREIIINGFKFKSIKTKNLKMNKSYGSKITTRNNAKKPILSFRFDIIGDKHIFYIYGDTCRARTIAQILASRQYFLDKPNKIYDYIVIATDFSEQYKLAFRKIKSLKINIKNILLVEEEKGYSFNEYIINKQKSYIKK